MPGPPRRSGRVLVGQDNEDVGRAHGDSLSKRLPFRAVPKCLRDVTAKRRYLVGVAKFLGFLLGVAVALAGPAVFGVLAAPGGIELNTKEMALAYGIGALIFWAVASYFSGAGALGAFVAFGALIYCWLWIPNRTTNFLNDVPGVTTGMIDGSRRYTLNGVVPILAVISLVYAIQLIVHSVQRRRRERVEADRLQREQEAAQAEQEADAAAVYPVAGSTYPAYGESFGNRSRFDDLFDDEQEPVQPRNQAEDQTDQYPTAGAEHTAQFRGAAPEDDASGNYPGDDTVLVPTDRDETVQVPAQQPEAAPAPQQPAGGAQAAGAAAVAGAAVAAERHESQQEKTVTPDDAPTAVAPQQPAAAPKVAPEQPAAAPEVKQPQAKQEPAPDADDATQGTPSAEPQADAGSPGGASAGRGHRRGRDAAGSPGRAAGRACSRSQGGAGAGVGGCR